MKILSHLAKKTGILIPVLLFISCGTPVNKSNKPVQNNASMIKITKSNYGKVEGKDVFLFTLICQKRNKSQYHELWRYCHFPVRS